MGMNYYVKKPLLSQEKTDELIKQLESLPELNSVLDQIKESLYTTTHIGKKSCGWKFLFSSKFQDIFDVNRFLLNNFPYIIDECSNSVALFDLIETIVRDQTNGKALKDSEEYSDTWTKYEKLDEQGFRFCLSEDFS